MLYNLHVYVCYILEYLIVTLIVLLFNFVMHCIISTVMVAFEINYLILSITTYAILKSYHPLLLVGPHPLIDTCSQHPNAVVCDSDAGTSIGVARRSE